MVDSSAEGAAPAQVLAAGEKTGAQEGKTFSNEERARYANRNHEEASMIHIDETTTSRIWLEGEPGSQLTIIITACNDHNLVEDEAAIQLTWMLFLISLATFWAFKVCAPFTRRWKNTGCTARSLTSMTTFLATVHSRISRGTSRS